MQHKVYALLHQSCETYLHSVHNSQLVLEKMMDKVFERNSVKNENQVFSMYKMKTKHGYK